MGDEREPARDEAPAEPPEITFTGGGTLRLNLGATTEGTGVGD